jgi:ABC-type sugar transport system substrate-binding protein
MKDALFITVIALLCVALLSASRSSDNSPHSLPNPTAQSDTAYRADYFYFQTTGTLKPLLSDPTYKAVVAAAKAAGYTEGEIEVTLYVVDRKSREERRFIPTATRQKLEKPNVRKFE